MTCIVDLVPKDKGLALFEQAANILQSTNSPAQSLLSILSAESPGVIALAYLVAYVPADTAQDKETYITGSAHSEHTGIVKPMADWLS